MLLTFEKALTIQEVTAALKFSYIQGKISQGKLEEFRKDWAEDSRYSFKIIDLRSKIGYIIVSYKGNQFLAKYKGNNEFEVEEV